jgi:hypothetical protein
MRERPRLINPFYGVEENDQHRSPPFVDSGSSHETVVSAIDGLLGTSSISSHSDDRDRGAAEPKETVDSGKGDPEQPTEAIEYCGSRLQRGPWLAQRAKA